MPFDTPTIPKLPSFADMVINRMRDMLSPPPDDPGDGGGGGGPIWYKLVFKRVKQCGLVEGARMHYKLNRQVGNAYESGVRVSAVFLGLDQSFGFGPKILFEAMIFGGQYDQDQYRYESYAAARFGFQKLCKRALGYYPKVPRVYMGRWFRKRGKFRPRLKLGHSRFQAMIKRRERQQWKRK